MAGAVKKLDGVFADVMPDRVFGEAPLVPGAVGWLSQITPTC
jgi:hypothetical protein